MRRQPSSSHPIWPIPAWVLTLGGFVLLLFLIVCYILFWPRHPDAARGGPVQTSPQTARLAPPSQLGRPSPAPQTGERQSGSNPAPSSATPILPPPPAQLTVPADTQVAVRTTSLIDSNADPVGSRFPGTMISPIAVSGQAIIPAGSAVVLHLANKKKTGFFHRSLTIDLALAGISVNGRIYPVQAGTLSIKAGQNDTNGGNESDEKSAPKGKKALVILPNTEMTFTLAAPLTIVSPSALNDGSVNTGKAK